jgi:hypothetical protein
METLEKEIFGLAVINITERFPIMKPPHIEHFPKIVKVLVAEHFYQCECAMHILSRGTVPLQSRTFT